MTPVERSLRSNWARCRKANGHRRPLPIPKLMSGPIVGFRRGGGALNEQIGQPSSGLAQLHSMASREFDVIPDHAHIQPLDQEQQVIHFGEDIRERQRLTRGRPRESYGQALTIGRGTPDVAAIATHQLPALLSTLPSGFEMRGLSVVDGGDRRSRRTRCQMRARAGSCSARASGKREGTRHEPNVLV